MKTAIISGINGQDGYYLSKLLLTKGYRVIGIQRRTSTSTAWRLADLPTQDNLIIEHGDITDYSSIARILKKWGADEFYNLAAQSHVGHSFKTPLATAEITGLGALNCLEAVRQEAPLCKFYQAGSSEQFGNSALHINDDSYLLDGKQVKLLTIDSPMIPRSSYGAAKLFAHNMVNNYREAYGVFAVGGILFNHESPYRGLEFVTRKITDSLARIKAGKQDNIMLGNLDSYRDWGHAEDYMRAAWQMLQQDHPKDYLIATGESYSIKDFLTLAFLCVGIDDWREYVVQDEELMRPSEVDVLIGDASAARADLGWQPNYDFFHLVHEMVAEDCMRHNVSFLLVDMEQTRRRWIDYTKLKNSHPIRRGYE